MVPSVVNNQFWHFSFILTASKIPTIQDLLGCFGVLGAPGEFVLQNAVSWLRRKAEPLSVWRSPVKLRFTINFAIL